MQSAGARHTAEKRLKNAAVQAICHQIKALRVSDKAEGGGDQTDTQRGVIGGIEGAGSTVSSERAARDSKLRDLKSQFRALVGSEYGAGRHRGKKGATRKKCRSPRARRTPPAPPAPRTPQTYTVNVGSRVKTISKRSPYDAKKLTPRCYLERHLRPNDAAFFSAAGVLPYRLDGTGRVFVLLGIEDQFDKVKRRVMADKVNFLGGKRDAGDMSAKNTAVRELWEESGGLLPVESTSRIVESLESVLWFRPGKYALFLHRISEVDADLPVRYAALPEGRRAELAEMKQLLWLPLDSLLRGKHDGLSFGFLVRAVFRDPLIQSFFSKLPICDEQASVAKCVRPEAASTQPCQTRAPAEAVAVAAGSIRASSGAFVPGKGMMRSMLRPQALDMSDRTG